MKLFDLPTILELNSHREVLQRIIDALDRGERITLSCVIDHVQLDAAQSFAILQELEIANRKALQALGVSDIQPLSRPAAIRNPGVPQ